ncbi:MAG: TolC family protein [Planctomycetota bacterium]
MKRSLLRYTAYLQLGIMILFATGCAPTQPFFLNESPDLQYYLDTATQVEYTDVDVESLAETTQAKSPLTMGNHDYQFWDLSLEECVNHALQNAKFFVTTSGNAEFRQNVAAQFTSASADQLGSIYDVAITQSTTQSIPLTVDGNGNRVLPRGILRANQIGGVEDALAEFDAQASAFVNVATTDRPQNTTLGVPLQTTVTTQQFTLSKRTATGGVLSLRQQTLYDRNESPRALVSPALRPINSAWTAVLEAEIQHPLMRNRGTLINRIPVVLASLNEDVAITDFEIQVRNLVRDVEVAYWNLYVAYRNVSAAVIGRNSAIATANVARLNLENGRGTKQQLAQAEEQYYNFRARLSAALAGSNVLGDDRQGVYGAERVLRELMGLSATDGRLIRPIEEPSLARIEYDWDESIAQLLYLSPELRRGRVVVKQRELEQISAKNQLMPEVNLSLLYRWVGVGDTFGPPSRRNVQFPTTGSSALGSLTSGDFQEGVVRLEYSPTAIGGRRERTRIRGAQLRLVQSRAFLQEAERLMVSQLSDAMAKVATHYQLVQTHAMRWQAAEQEVEARLAEFKGGRGTINVVLQSQQRRADAQIAYYRALGEYNKSINYVDYLKGSMLANNNITLSEGPWNERAYWDALERARERSAGRHWKYGVTRPNVVRNGPLMDPEYAAMTGDMHGVEGLPPGSVLFEEPINDAVEVGDVPLGEMGSSQGEMLNDPSLNPNGMIPPVEGNPGVEQVPVPSADQIPNVPQTGTPQAAPTPQVAPNANDGAQTPSAGQVRPRGRVIPMSYQEEMVPAGAAPPPVHRTPLPR